MIKILKDVFEDFDWNIALKILFVFGAFALVIVAIGMVAVYDNSAYFWMFVPALMMGAIAAGISSY